MVHYQVNMPLDSHVRIGSGQSAQELAAADWWSRNRLSLHQAGYIALIGFSVLTWGYGLWTLFDTYALSYPKEQAYTNHIAKTTLTQDAYSVAAPQPLQLGGALSLNVGTSQQSLYAPASNPNTLWWARIHYRFRDGNTETPLRETILLPGDARFLTELGWDGQALRTPALSIVSTDWQRIDASLVNGDYETFKQGHSTLLIQKPQYQSDLTINEKKLGRSTFTVQNPSGFSYRNTELLTILYSNGTIVGMNKQVLPYIPPGMMQDFSLVWPENPSNVTKTEVKLFIPYLDPETFKPLVQ